MAKHDHKKQASDLKRDSGRITVFGAGTEFRGVLRFRETLRIRGTFKGTIEPSGNLFVDKDAVVEADAIHVSSLTVAGTVSGAINAMDTVEMLSGSTVKGDVSAARLRIMDGVLFEGQCAMTGIDEDVEIFTRSSAEIKADLQRVPPRPSK